MKRLFGIIIIMTILVSMTACANSEITEPDIIEHDAVLSSAESSAASSGYISIGEQSEESSVPESSAFESASSKPSESSSAAESSSTSSSKPESSSKPQSESSKPASSSAASQSSSKPASENSSSEQKPQDNTAPTVTGEVKAMWISYLEYQSMLTGKSEKEFKNSIKAMFTNLANDGFNTVYVHARSHSDAYYNSDIFPWSVYCTRTVGQNPGFDPL